MDPDRQNDDSCNSAADDVQPVASFDNTAAFVTALVAVLVYFQNFFAHERCTC